MRGLWQWWRGATQAVSESPEFVAPKLELPVAEEAVAAENRAARRRKAQKPFRPHRSQSQIAANWEFRQSDGYRRAQAEREKRNEAQNHGDDHEKREILRKSGVGPRPRVR